jgi:pheromone shutdown protein TraB
MITLLGVGHVFDIGDAIRGEILHRRPRVVALELDSVRYQALMNRTPRARGISPLALLAQFQVRIARQYGVEVGDEMVAAARAAQEIGSEIALIDQDSRSVLGRVWREMSFGERVRLLVSTVGGFLTRRERVEAELQRFYQDERSFLGEFARELPTAKRILIDERDASMAFALRRLEEAKGDVVAVVGEGHLDGLLRHLAGAATQVVHLQELRSAPSGPNASVNVSVQL